MSSSENVPVARDTGDTPRFDFPTIATPVSPAAQRAAFACTRVGASPCPAIPWQLASACTLEPLGRQTIPVQKGAQPATTASASAIRHETASRRPFLTLSIRIIINPNLVGLGGVEPPTRSLGIPLLFPK